MPYFAHELGQAGEAAAADFYRQAGYTIRAQGYRHGRAEVDLIAQRGQELLVFIEVKTRSGGQYGTPETFDPQKRVVSPGCHAFAGRAGLARRHPLRYPGPHAAQPGLSHRSV